MSALLNLDAILRHRVSVLQHLAYELAHGNRIVDYHGRPHWYAPDENGEPHFRNHEATAEETALIDSLREEVGHDA